MSYERQEVIGEFLSFELSPKPFEHLKDSLDDVRSKFVRLYLGELEIARMLNPILTIQLLNEFKDKILITQTEVIMAFLEDDIELSDNNENDVESENTDTEDEDAEEENEVTESDVMDFQHFYTIFLDIIHSINSETLERLKRQVGV